MNFIEITELLRRDNNKEAKRKSCGFKVSTNGTSLLFDEGKGKEWYFPSIKEILSEDWELVEEKLHTFEEAITALKNGKVIYRKADKERVYTSYNGQMFFYDLGRSETLHIVNAFYPDILANDWIIEYKQ